ARRVRGLVLRQDEPRAALLAFARPRGDPLRREARTGADGRGRGDARGVLARGRLLRLLGRRPQPPPAELLLVHRSRAAWTALAAAATGRGALDRVWLGVARITALRRRPKRRRPAGDAAVVPREQLPGRRWAGRLGHRRPHVELVPRLVAEPSRRLAAS